MLERGSATSRRLPFHFQAQGGVGRLVLEGLAVGQVTVDKLELEVTDLGAEPGDAVAERFQRKRTRLRGLAMRVLPHALDERIAEVEKQLAALGITQIAARLDDGFVAVRLRAADGLATADLSFHVELVGAGAQLRALVSTVRVHGHLPTSGPVLADRVLGVLVGAEEVAGTERPYARGLCDVEVDLVGAMLWQLMPPNGWRLPAVAELELTHIRIARGAIEIAYGPAGTRPGELGVRPNTHKLAAAHDLMHSIDQQLRSGHLEEAMRGYRGLLASSGPDQPVVLERILALAAARPAWFVDGLELARQALGRWPEFAPAHAALASITLAQGDAREAAKHLDQVARMASAEGDDDQAALAALAAARLLRVLDPKAATQLYQLAFDHDADSAEAADSLADRLADEQRWAELVRLVRARLTAAAERTRSAEHAGAEHAGAGNDHATNGAAASDAARQAGAASDAARAKPALDAERAVQLHLRLAEVLVHHLGDPVGAEHELAAARTLAPDDPAVHELTATLLVASAPEASIAAWHEVARLAEARGDHRTGARAWARIGDLRATPRSAVVGASVTTAAATPPAASEPTAEPAARPEPADRGATDAWRRALELDPLQPDALVGLAGAAADRGDHGGAAELYERLRGLGLAQPIAARHELSLARSLVLLGRIDDARTSLRRAAQAGGETAAEAHAMFAEIADAASDREHAAAELDTAIVSFVELASDHVEADRMYTRAAELAVARAMLFDRSRQSLAADADWQRAHELAHEVAPEIARDAARTLLARAGHDAGTERRWIDAVLATRPPQSERAALLVRRADVRRREPNPDLAAALADLHEAIELSELVPEQHANGLTDTRRRAYQLEAQLFAESGDQRSRAQALAALAKLAERAHDRIASETAAAAAWLAADEPAAALPHGARAHALLLGDSPDRGDALARRDARWGDPAGAAGGEGTGRSPPGESAGAAGGPPEAIPSALRREVEVTLGEAAWRQRAWPDVIRAYRGLLADPPPDLFGARLASYRYRLAVAADRTGDPEVALTALRPLIDDGDATRGASPELRGQALRLFSELAERAGDLSAAATAIERAAAIGSEGSDAGRAEAMFRAGELFRRAERADDAIRCLDATLRIAETHMPALDALEVAWRERGDLERVAAVLGRKIAATTKQPSRQKPLLSRLGDLQDQLGRTEVALETHQRALEIDPMWRPSLRYVTLGLRDAGQVVAAAGGLAKLAGELHGDTGVDLAIVARERQIAAEALAELIGRLDDAQLEAVRIEALPVLERAALDNADVAAGLVRLRGNEPAPDVPVRTEDAPSGRVTSPFSATQSLRDAAARARSAGNFDDARTNLETANQENPGDPHVVRELADLASETGDHAGAARHLIALAPLLAGARRADVLLELADIYYDKLDDAVRARDTMRGAAEAFGSGSRRDATLRLLSTEAGTHLAWDITVESLLSISLEKRTQADFASLATALMRAGRDADAVASIEAATTAGRYDDGGELLRQLSREIQRKIDLARVLEDRASGAAGEEAAALLDEAQQLRIAIGQAGRDPLRDIAAPSADAIRIDTAPWPLRTKTKPGVPQRRVTPGPIRTPSPPPVSEATGATPEPANDDEPNTGVPAAVETLDSTATGAALDAAALAEVNATTGTAQPASQRIELPVEPALDASADAANAATEPAADAADAASEPAADAADAATEPAADAANAATEPAADAADAGDAQGAAATSGTTAAPPSEPAPATTSTLDAPDDDANRAAIDAGPALEAAPLAAQDTTSSLAAAGAQDTTSGNASIDAAIDASIDAALDALDASPEEPAPLASPPQRTDDASTAPPLPDPPAHGATGSTADDDLPVPTELPPAGSITSSWPVGETRRDKVTSPMLGRIRLIPRAVTRPGLGTMREFPLPPPEDDDDSGGWQSVSDPSLKSGPWGPGTPEPPRPPPTARSAPDPTRPPVLARAKSDSVRAPAIARTHSGVPAISRPPAEPARTKPESGRTPAVRPRPPSAPPSQVPTSSAPLPPIPAIPPPAAEPDLPTPSVTITGTPDETALALLLAAASADRDRLFAARRAEPDDPAMLLAVLAHLGDREPALRRQVLDEAAQTSHGRALAIALHELAILAREAHEPARATAQWQRAHGADPSFAPVWMPLADALAASDELSTARDLYDRVSHSIEYDEARRAFAADRADALGRDESIVSGEIRAVRDDELAAATRGERSAPPISDLDEARRLAGSEDWTGAIAAAERAAAAHPNDRAVLETLETVYLGLANVPAASEAIGRQLAIEADPARRAALWMRRARMYRAAGGREAEAYRCLQEAHACSPADPEIAYQLRAAAMVRGEWPLAASLLYREIAAAKTPRDRGALHLELALIYQERLDDPAQAQTNFEQAFAFDPTIPAVKLPLARRYEALGRTSEAAKLYEEAAATARAADRPSLLEAAARCRAVAVESAEPDVAAQLDRAEAAGDRDAALELAHQLWRAEPGHAAAFRTLAGVHRTSGDLAALTELTRTRASHAETPDERATAWLEVARLAEDVGALDQAARAYDLALIEDPGHIGALDARGGLAFRVADYATADLIYRDLGAGESVLGDDELALRRSIIAEQLGRDSEALQLAQHAVSLAPGRRDVVMRVQELATRIGELPIALAAARHVLELVPLDDDEAQIAIQFAVVELLRELGQLDEAVAQLERIVRDHPVHAGAIEALAQVHAARGDWHSATRYLYQLVPLAPSPSHRAERLYQLGEAVLTHVRDVDRADDVFLRASDLDPGHIPTLRRLLDVYWRADEPTSIVEVATELADKGALISGPTSDAALARALVAAAVVGDTQLAQRLHAALGDDGARQITSSLAELAGRHGRLQFAAASTAIADFGRRGFIDLAKLRAAAAGTPLAGLL